MVEGAEGQWAKYTQEGPEPQLRSHAEALREQKSRAVEREATSLLPWGVQVGRAKQEAGSHSRTHGGQDTLGRRERDGSELGCEGKAHRGGIRDHRAHCEAGARVTGRKERAVSALGLGCLLRVPSAGFRSMDDRGIRSPC